MVQAKAKGELIHHAELEGGDKLVLRMLRGNKGYVHLAREKGEEQVWRETLFGVPKPFQFVVENDQVFLRLHRARGEVAMAAFSLSDGRRAWVSEGAVSKKVEPIVAEPSVFLFENSLVWLEGGDSPELVEVDKKSGKVIKRQQIVAASRLSVKQEGQTIVVVSGESESFRYETAD